MPERVERDDVIDAVKELGAKERLHAALVVQEPVRADLLVEPEPVIFTARAEVRGHHQHGVAKIDRPARGIGQATIAKDLEQEVMHVSVRLLDLIEQDHTERLQANAPGEFSVGSRGGPDQPRDRHRCVELAHIEADHALVGAKELLGQCLGGFGLTDTARADE